jgi:hypothetical protein
MLDRSDIEVRLHHPEPLRDICWHLVALRHVDRLRAGVGHMLQLNVQRLAVARLAFVDLVAAIPDQRI